MTTDPYRLPRAVTPSHYDVAIAPDLERCVFDGTATIEVDVHEPVTQVVLNAIELTINEVTLAGQRGEVQLDDHLERMTVTFPAAVPAGTASLKISYAGRINDDLRGFYRSTYTDADGIERVIATTQFESTDARRAFPCWDEPDFKATFAISLLVPDGLLGLSNGAVVSEVKTDGGTWVTFDRTMKMSTYIVAFIVGPLVTTEAVDVDGVPLRVACVPGREPLTEFALDVGAHALRFLADYFGIPYPAGKLDLVALPDFAFGAMENLGCVTFRETALLVDKGNAGRIELERVADVVSHEIAHMWFGDLVTMKWWNGIWLNEAFATFMELTTVDAFRPQWERWLSFGTERALAMSTDGLAATRPIEYEVVSPEDAEGMFDVLTYQKGGAVLRMLETYLGADRFRDGIRHYLDSHRYANTETTDLWDAIEDATGEPVRSIMDSWIFQGGHPVVTATRDGDRVHLTQQRFRYHPDPGDLDARWEVPVLMRATDGTAERVLFNGGSVDVPASGPLVVNAGGWGVFRTRYSGDLLEAVQAGFADLQPLERFNFVSDTWASVLAGQSDVGDFIGVLQRLGDERDPSVWESALGGLDLLHRAAPAARSGFGQWLRSLARPLLDSLGWDARPDEDERTAHLRGILVDLLGTIGGDTDIVDRARQFHAEIVRGGTPVAPDLVTPIVSVVAWNGSVDDYELFWERIRNPATPQEEVRYLFRLTSFPQPELALRTLEATATDIRTQNGAFVITGCVANRWTGPAAWRWLATHWDDALKRIPDNSHGRMLEGVSRLIDPESVNEVRAFLAEHPVPSARKQVDQVLERQQVNAAFAAQVAPILAEKWGATPSGR